MAVQETTDISTNDIEYGDAKQVVLVKDVEIDSLFAVTNPNTEQDDPLRSETLLLQPGDVLESINNQHFSSLPQVESYLQSLVGVIVITVSTTSV